VQIPVNKFFPNAPLMWESGPDARIPTDREGLRIVYNFECMIINKKERTAQDLIQYDKDKLEKLKIGLKYEFESLSIEK